MARPSRVRRHAPMLRAGLRVPRASRLQVLLGHVRHPTRRGAHPKLPPGQIQGEYSAPTITVHTHLLLLFCSEQLKAVFSSQKAWKEAGTPVACERARAKLENIMQQRSNQHAKMAQINAERHALRTLLAALDDIEPVDTDDVDAEEENPALVHVYSYASKAFIRLWIYLTQITVYFCTCIYYTVSLNMAGVLRSLWPRGVREPRAAAHRSLLRQS